MTGLSVIGLNYETAPLEVREMLALGPDLTRRLLHRFHAETVFEEALVLDTCNRTEIYFVARDAPDPLGYLLSHIGDLKGTVPTAPDLLGDRMADPSLAGRVPGSTALFYRYDNLEAVEHLFRVAAALDSQMVGEHQILGQVKDAYRLAVEARTARFLLNRLLHWAFRVGKRVQTETELGRGSASIAHAAVDRARRTLRGLEGKTAILVGAGKNAELAARILLRSGLGRLILANRTLHRAEQLAQDLMRRPAVHVRVPVGKTPIGGTACAGKEDGPPGEPHAESDACPPSDGRACPPPQTVTLEEIPRLIGQADLVISSTGSPQFVLDRDGLAPSLRRLDHPLVIMDIAVPRDADPRLADLPNVFLYTMDDLERQVAENLERRRDQIPRASEIVAEEVRAFAQWLDSLQVAPTIRLLQKRLDQVQRGLLEKHAGQFTRTDRPQLQRFTKSLCRRILHDPIQFLRRLPEQASVSDTLATVETIRKMFDLDSLNEDPKDE